MNTPDLFPSPSLPLSESPRLKMNGKPVHFVPAKTVINFNSGFVHKLLCDGPTFSLGTACVYNCSFCYVPDMMRKQAPYLESLGIHGRHEDMVIRRRDGLRRLREELTHRDGSPKFRDLVDRRVIYSSPFVDVAGNMDLVRETAEACKIILELTNWQIRLLSKSNLLPQIAKAIPDRDAQRVIYGVSTGTLDDGLAAAFEAGTPKVSKRIESLHWLQDHGFRTFGMICPSLPQVDYNKFARDMAAAIRAEKCEHVWAEVINVRGESYNRTLKALSSAGFDLEADMLAHTFTDEGEWELYARATFEAHVASGYKPGQLRFLQYVNANSKPYWQSREKSGAILL